MKNLCNFIFKVNIKNLYVSASDNPDNNSNQDAADRRSLSTPIPPIIPQIQLSSSSKSCNNVSPFEMPYLENKIDTRKQEPLRNSSRSSLRENDKLDLSTTLSLSSKSDDSHMQELCLSSFSTAKSSDGSFNQREKLCENDISHLSNNSEVCISSEENNKRTSAQFSTSAKKASPSCLGPPSISPRSTPTYQSPLTYVAPLNNANASIGSSSNYTSPINAHQNNYNVLTSLQYNTDCSFGPLYQNQSNTSIDSVNSNQDANSSKR